MKKTEHLFPRNTTLERLILIVQLQFKTKETAHPITL